MAVGLAVGGALIVAFLHLLNVNAVYQRLQHLSISYALMCGAVFLSAYVVRAVRWRCLLRPCRVSLRRTIAIYQVGIFLNWLLPIRGGEIAMSLLLRRSDGITVSRSLATVSMDKALDLMAVLALLAVLPFVPVHLSYALWVLLLSALAVVGLGVAVLALAGWRRQRSLDLVFRPVARLMPSGATERIEAFVLTFVDTLLALIRQPRIMITAAAYTVVALLLDALFCLLAFRAVATVVPIPVVLYGYTLFNLSFVLPSPPGQVGSNELIGLLIFSGSFGISRSAVGAMFLFSHPWTAFLMTCAGLACLSAMGLKMRSTLRLAQGERGALAAAKPGEAEGPGAAAWPGRTAVAGHPRLALRARSHHRRRRPQPFGAGRPQIARGLQERTVPRGPRREDHQEQNREELKSS
jgi:uncharacterized protein (TIRG00374 family)